MMSDVTSSSTKESNKILENHTHLICIHLLVAINIFYVESILCMLLAVWGQIYIASDKGLYLDIVGNTTCPGFYGTVKS